MNKEGERKISRVVTWRKREEKRKKEKETNLNHMVLSNQTVPGSQIAMDKIFGLQVGHASSNLSKMGQFFLGIQYETCQ